MIRPTVTTFLDKMMRRDNPTLQVEEIEFSDKFVGKTLLDIQIDNFINALILAVRKGSDWISNPE